MLQKATTVEYHHHSIRQRPTTLATKIETEGTGPGRQRRGRNQQLGFRSNKNHNIKTITVVAQRTRITEKLVHLILLCFHPCPNPKYLCSVESEAAAAAERTTRRRGRQPVCLRGNSFSVVEVVVLVIVPQTANHHHQHPNATQMEIGFRKRERNETTETLVVVVVVVGRRRTKLVQYLISSVSHPFKICFLLTFYLLRLLVVVQQQHPTINETTTTTAKIEEAAAAVVLAKVAQPRRRRWMGCYPYRICFIARHRMRGRRKITMTRSYPSRRSNPTRLALTTTKFEYAGISRKRVMVVLLRQNGPLPKTKAQPHLQLPPTQLPVAQPPTRVTKVRVVERR